ncbi:MAG: hypothetical protein ACFCVG_13430 [Kineosporiaceae bacterium]
MWRDVCGSVETNPGVQARLTIRGPGRAFEMAINSELVVTGDEPELDGERSTPFAAQVIVPVTAEGRYEVALELGGEPVATQAFAVQREVDEASA